MQCKYRTLWERNRKIRYTNPTYNTSICIAGHLYSYSCSGAQRRGGERGHLVGICLRVSVINPVFELSSRVSPHSGILSSGTFPISRVMCDDLFCSDAHYYCRCVQGSTVLFHVWLPPTATTGHHHDRGTPGTMRAAAARSS